MIADALTRAALAVGPGRGFKSGIASLVGFVLASTISAQGYHALFALRTVPWYAVLPTKTVAVTTAVLANLALFGREFSMSMNQGYHVQVGHSAALIMQAPWLALVSIFQIGREPGRLKTAAAAMFMTALVPLTMTVVDGVLARNKPDFKTQKSKFLSLSLSANVLSVATAYAILYTAFGARNAVMYSMGRLAA